MDGGIEGCDGVFGHAKGKMKTSTLGGVNGLVSLLGKYCEQADDEVRRGWYPRRVSANLEGSKTG